MQHETRSRSNPAEKTSLPKSHLTGTVPILPGKKASGAVMPTGSVAVSLTARMIDYRSWWNLPRSKSKKSQP